MWPPLQTALISAVTAAAVTLLIEFAVKPRLEARKDRVVEQHRRRRALRSRVDYLRVQIDDIWSSIGTLMPTIPESTNPPAQPPETERARRLIEACRDDLRQMGTDIDELFPVLSKWQVCALGNILSHINAAFKAFEILVYVNENNFGDALSLMKKEGIEVTFLKDIDAVVSDLRREADLAYGALASVTWWRRSYHRSIKRFVIERPQIEQPQM
jgi:hypothetical protein